MAGNKNSGKKSNYEKAKNMQLQELSIDYLVDNFETFPQATKLKIALNIASKIMPQTQNINQTVEERKKEQADSMYKALRRYKLEHGEQNENW